MVKRRAMASPARASPARNSALAAALFRNLARGEAGAAQCSVLSPVLHMSVHAARRDGLRCTGALRGRHPAQSQDRAGAAQHILL